MKAFAITRAATNGSNIPFINEITLPIPQAQGHDLLVEIKAISVNPVDTKVRAGFSADTPRVLGWDAVGVVKAVGNEVTLFSPGDEVWYAGALGRPGSNSEFQLVDERIVALKPRSLDNASAAALPLTAITAWELLFDRLGVTRDGNEGDTLLIVGAAGGVEAVVCAKSIQDGFVHQTVGTKEADAECDLNYCIGTPVETDVKLAMSNSLGFGGHNAVLLFQKYE